MTTDDPLWYKDAIIYEANIRAFHDAVLEQGAVPLSLLEPYVKHWIDSQAAH